MTMRPQTTLTSASIQPLSVMVERSLTLGDFFNVKNKLACLFEMFYSHAVSFLHSLYAFLLFCKLIRIVLGIIFCSSNPFRVTRFRLPTLARLLAICASISKGHGSREGKC